MTELYGRTFATWTLTTCALCLICAKNPRVPAIYGEQKVLPLQKSLPLFHQCPNTDDNGAKGPYYGFGVLPIPICFIHTKYLWLKGGEHPWHLLWQVQER